MKETNRRNEKRRILLTSSLMMMGLSSITMLHQCNAFSPSFTKKSYIKPAKLAKTYPTFISKQKIYNFNLYLQAPPGSGYLNEEEEPSFFPKTYEPMMEYPGTMRPGRTPENQPYSSLPIQESDPDPVPWPHFQEIEWHHNWGSPHEHPIPMEEFIDMHGRWATAEMEAEMRAGARRGVRERRELEEAQKAASFILDDDDEEDEERDSGPQLELGEGVDALIGAGAAAAASISDTSSKERKSAQLDEDDDDDDGGDNFLLDLGLDDATDGDDEDEGEEPAFATGDDGTDGILEAMQSMIDAEDDSSGSNDVDDDDNDIDIDFDDLGLNFDDSFDDDGDDDLGDDESDDDNNNDDDDDYVVMDDDDISMESNDMTLDEMIGNEDMGADDDFDDGGFDYD